jgi:UDP-N-acetylmuramoyl-tripeptide--D-alanyl-D-alanine ligase
VFEITIDQLLQVTGGDIQRGSFAGDKVIRGISIDSRSLKKGSLFVAVPGERFDGHEFVKDAVDRGAQAAVVAGNRWPATDQKNSGEAAVISVKDTKKALRDLASWYRAKFDIPTVAVTGTNGKTTTKEMIAQVLSAKLRLVRSPRSYNNLIGVPLTIFRLNPGSEALVVELGMSQPGEIAILTRMAKPKIGVITNIGPAHLESMHSLERIAQAKFELADNMAAPKTLVLNADDPILKKRIEEKRSDERIVSFGIENQADFRADQIRFGPDGLISFRLNRDLAIDLLLLGRHNVYNALAAIAVGSLLGVDPVKAKEKLARYTPSDLRMELVHIKDITVINDSYNANPVSVTKALETLKEMRIQGRKIAVLADMLELGEKAVDFHLQVGRKAAKLGIDLLLVVGELARHIAQGAREMGMQAEQVQTFETNQQVSHYLLENLKSGDLVLVKGSRKMGVEEVVTVLRSLYGRQN